MNNTEWSGILDRDEKILWQGRPDGRFSTGFGAFFKIPFFTFFTGFSVFWMWGASQAGGVFWMFGLLFFFAGLSGLTWAIIGSTLTRRNSWYTLTTSRAMIATNLPFQGKKLKSYPITQSTNLDFRDGDPASIFFASETRRGNDNDYTVEIGFERIRDGRVVYQHFRSIQNGHYREDRG